MIINEYININNKTFKKTYSDEGYKIKKVSTSEMYSEALDVYSNDFEYVETDEKIEDEERVE